MTYTRLGTTGLTVSRICLGTMTYGSSAWRPWVLDEDDARPFYRRAIELGINFFDTANMYSAGASEEVTGRALAEFSSRDDVVIATKVYFPMGDGPNRSGLSRKHILSAVDASLKRLGTDYIDLYQIHRYDENTPDEEMLRALEDIVRSGRARYIGASSMSAWQFTRLLYIARELGVTRFVSMQPHYNLLYREEEREMLPLCMAEGIGVIPWSPIARGRLARPAAAPETATRRAETDTLQPQLYGHPSDQHVIAAVERVAKERGISQAQVAIAWQMARPEVTAPIVGASKLTHLEDLCAGAEVTLSGDEVAALEMPYEPHPVAGARPAPPKSGTPSRD